MVLAMVTGGVAGAGAVAGSTGGAGGQQGSAQVTFTEQTSGGQTVVVDSVTMSEGGFVAIHDGTLNDGHTLGSVVGSSSYLEAGTHVNVTVHLDEQLSEDTTLIAMPHKDTDGDRSYEFVPTQGEEDGPYTEGDEIVVQGAEVTVSATVSMSDQPTDGQFVNVDRAELSNGGFVTIHDSSLLDGDTFDSVRGSSDYLGAGIHEDIRVRLHDELTNEDTLIPMAHQDTNDNKQYDFVTGDGAEDGPYVNHEGGAVIDTATVTPTDEASVGMSDTSTSGHYVSVDEAFLPNGGFVTIHDSTVLDGAVFDSIRGSSDYLEPGLHRNVGVHFNEDATLAEDDTLVPMAHQDTDNDEQYEFAETDGSEDGPYTNDDGEPVVDTAAATVSADVSIDQQASNGRTVVVNRVDLTEPGFVTIHDASLGAGETLGSVRGSKFLEAGHHHDVEVQLSSPLTESQGIIPMAHKDTNDNQEYDFVDTEGSEDGPFTANGDIVLDSGRVTVTSQVTYKTQSTTGDSVTVQSVTMHDGGFVTIHDSSLLDGATFDSVRGTSAYLGPGTHEGVDVTLDEPLEEATALIAMPHRDTNDNEQYDFVTSDGAEDAPYIASGDIVLASAKTSVVEPASASISDQTSDGSTVVVDDAQLPQGGFVTIHDGSLLDGSTFDSVRGTSGHLEAGSYSDIEISLDDPYEADGAIIAMPHKDTNGNQAYDFVSSDGAEDGPYTIDGDIVLDDAALTVEDGGSPPADTSQPGFGILVVVLALIGTAGVARFR